MIRSEVFRNVGLFQTGLGPTGGKHLGGEDSEMVRRLLTAGKRLVYAPSAVVLHKVPRERMTLAYLRKWNYWMARANTRISEFHNVTPAVLFGDCLKSALVALSYYGIGARTRAVGAEITFWWRLGMLVELFSSNRSEKGNRSLSHATR